MGERFTNKITSALLVGSRAEQAWITKSHIRQLGMMPSELPTKFLISDWWINYDFHYYLPFSPQLFNKYMEKIYDAKGEVTHIKINMSPIKFGKLSLLRIADKKISQGYYSILNTNRTFYIDLSDTTISELHVEDVNQYKLKGKELSFTQSSMTMHYKFERDKEQMPFLAYGSIAHTWMAENRKTNYKAFQQIWLGKPENADNLTTAEIAARAKRPVTATTFKRDGMQYLFSLDQNEMALMNDSNFWRGKRMPDYLIASAWYTLFAADPNYALFVK